MRLFFLLLTAAFLFSGCNKSKNNDLCYTYLSISSTNTPSLTSLQGGITSTVSSYGPNLCYQFREMEITQQPTPSGPVYQFEYFIRVKATIPCGSPICQQAIYNSVNSISLHPPATGTYYLHFYNQSLLFKTDTIVVQ